MSAPLPENVDCGGGRRAALSVPSGVEETVIPLIVGADGN